MKCIQHYLKHIYSKNTCTFYCRAQRPEDVVIFVCLEVESKNKHKKSDNLSEKPHPYTRLKILYWILALMRSLLTTFCLWIYTIFCPLELARTEFNCTTILYQPPFFSSFPSRDSNPVHTKTGLKRDFPPRISPTKFPRLIIANTNGVYKWVVIIQFINCMNMPVYKLPHHNQLINGSILGDDNWVI